MSLVKRDQVANVVKCSAALAREFTYHPPQGDQGQRYQEINAAARDLAATIEQLCPDTPERQRAIDAVKDARMRANASIATSTTPPAIAYTGHGA